MNDEAKPVVLCVDDEENILSSLKRTFRPLGYTIHTYESAVEALRFMRDNSVNVVVSDMRMPEMDGAQFLEQVAKFWPDCVRILLTGYSDVASTVAAINKGNIYRYVSKPWDDAELKITVQQGLEQQTIKRDRDRLLKLTRLQNKKLSELNESLEQRVKERTEEIQQTAEMLDLMYEELKTSYKYMVPIFSSLIEMREGACQGHSSRVADLTVHVANKMNLPQEQVDEIYYASLLHDIGKIGLPDSLISKPFVSLSASERLRFIKHPIMGQAALLSVEQLSNSGDIIRAHHERMDGKGYPDHLIDDEISIGARILCVINDFDELQYGVLFEKPLSLQESKAYLEENAGTHYDPEVVAAFIEWLNENPDYLEDASVLYLNSGDLKPGMVLAKDLSSKDGLLLLSKGHQLTENIIQKIIAFENEDDKTYTILIELESAPDFVSAI